MFDVVQTLHVLKIVLAKRVASSRDISGAELSERSKALMKTARATLMSCVCAIASYEVGVVAICCIIVCRRNEVGSAGSPLGRARAWLPDPRQYAGPRAELTTCASMGCVLDGRQACSKQYESFPIFGTVGYLREPNLDCTRRYPPTTSERIQYATMGASESKLAFKEDIFRLAGEEIIPIDSQWWSRVCNKHFLHH